MDFKVPLIIGGILIVTALLLWKYPSLLSGYYSIPQRERDSREFKQYILRIRNTLIIVGLIMIVGGFLFSLL